jgi:hypothetical protein
MRGRFVEELTKIVGGGISDMMAKVTKVSVGICLEAKNIKENTL